MIHRTAAFILVLIASVTLLAIAVIPHHHHQDDLCFQKYHNHHHQNDNENERSTCHVPGDTGDKNSDLCILKIFVIYRSSHLSQEEHYTSSAEDQPHIKSINDVFPYSGINEFIPVSLLVTTYVHHTSSYSPLADSFIGLRAPPVI